MIGIFDSGSGGLTVLNALHKKAPQADILYFGDIKNAPYGEKSREVLNELTVIGIQKLINNGATEIVSACNSVSVSVLKPWFKDYGVPYSEIIEMVGPTVESLKDTKGKVLIIATRATIESGVYQNGFRNHQIECDEFILSGLVDLIENGASKEEVKQKLECDFIPHIQGQYEKMLLGCTHFPLMTEVFETVLRDGGINTQLVDPAEAVANDIVRKCNCMGSGKTVFTVSKQSNVFEKVAASIFSKEKVSVRIF